MENLFKGITGVFSYQDDILIMGKITAEHLKTLKSVFNVITEAGLKFKCEKCMFMAPKVRYLG